MTDPVFVKALAPVTKAADDESAPYGSFEVVLSTPELDRDGEEVKAGEWESPLPEHIPFDVDHGMSVASTVGSGAPSLDKDGRLVVRGTWASTQLAQQTRTLVNEGHIRNVSVAFLRKYLSDGDDSEIVRRELLNGAFVAVPANPKAVIVSSKSLTEIQAEHDALVKAGAHCEVEEKSAIGTHSTATDDGEWSKSTNVGRIPNDASPTTLRREYAWVDPDGDPASKSSYKFPHHFVSESGSVGAASTKACSSAIAVLNGGRGGTDIPSGDRKSVYSHLARHLRDADMEPPELKNFEGSESASEAASDAVAPEGATAEDTAEDTDERAVEKETAARMAAVYSARRVAY